MKTSLPINLSEPDYYTKPFSFICSSNVLEPQLSLDLLYWLENFNSWKLIKTDFYEQYEFSFQDVNLPISLSCFEDGSFNSSVHKTMSELFEVVLEDSIDIVAHKLIPGQNIGIHNDSLEGEETHRLIIQLNSGWEEDYGGYFMIFKSDDAQDIQQVITPIHNSAIGFAITENSHHAVSKVYKANRYTIVCSLKARC